MANINFRSSSIRIFSLVSKIKKGMPEDDDDDRPFGGDIHKYLLEVNNRLQYLMGSPQLDGTYQIPLTFREYPTEVSYRHPFKKRVGTNNESVIKKPLDQALRGASSRMEANQKKNFVSSFNTLDQVVIEPSKATSGKPNTRKDTGADILGSKNKLLPTTIGDYKKDTGPDQSTKQESIIPNKEVKKNVNSALKKVDPQTPRKDQPPQTYSQGQSQKKDVPKKKEDSNSAQKKDQGNKKSKPA